MTTFNRKEMTKSCIESLVNGNPDIDFRFVITDDNSSDGTDEMLRSLPYKIKVLSGNGNLFWNGGMRKSLAYALLGTEKYDYAMLVNDDVRFYENAIEKQLEFNQLYKNNKYADRIDMDKIIDQRTGKRA